MGFWVNENKIMLSMFTQTDVTKQWKILQQNKTKQERTIYL